MYSFVFQLLIHYWNCRFENYYGKVAHLQVITKKMTVVIFCDTIKHHVSSCVCEAGDGNIYICADGL